MSLISYILANFHLLASLLYYIQSVNEVKPLKRLLWWLATHFCLFRFDTSIFNYTCYDWILSSK